MVSFGSYNEFFKGKTEAFPVMRFFLELTQHIPLKSSQYIRRYGLTSLTGLEGLTSIGGDLRIFKNPTLPTSLAWDFATRVDLDIGGDVFIEHNGP